MQSMTVRRTVAQNVKVVKVREATPPKSVVASAE
jgi:hypothetical protein